MTQRNFLFAPTDPDAATTRLIATAASATGFMNGEPGLARPGWYVPGADNHAMLTELRDQLALSYPDAGAPLWAVRLWTNLLWQPAYLAVIAVHLHGAVPDLRGLSQQRRGIYVDGFRLMPQPMLTKSTEAMIDLAAAKLKTMADEMLIAVNALEKLRPIAAQRLFADRMLGLMVWLGQRRRDLTPDGIDAYAARWLEQLDLTGHGQLKRVFASDRTLLITQRKGCCLDYLIDPDRLCANCPRQDPELRIARQTANALAESP